MNTTRKVLAKGGSLKVPERTIWNKVGADGFCFTERSARGKRQDSMFFSEKAAWNQGCSMRKW